MPCFRSAVAAALIVSTGLFALVPADAAESARDAFPAAPGAEKRITLSQTVEPSFHIEPIVHRFEARRGAEIPFKFEIRSNGKPMDVSIVPVNLRQQLNGLILHDLQGDPPAAMTFTSPTELRLSPGETHEIEGIVKVPLAKSNFLSYGVLVRDNGSPAPKVGATAEAEATTAKIRFVTQYVLRIDIETGVKDLSQMSQLYFERGEVVSHQGMPIAQTLLINPTNFAYECTVRGNIESPAASQSRPFRLGLPCRAALADDERYVVRIMPNSRVIVKAPLDTLLFPGQQTFDLEITNGRRAVVQNAFDIDVRHGEFPGLAAQIAYLDDEMSVQPAQIEVGTIKGTKRSCNLRFSNSSNHPKSVKIEALKLDDSPLEGLRLSSSEFEIKAGRNKTIRTSILSAADPEATCGRLVVTVTDGQGQQHQQILPVTTLLAQRPPTDVQVGELELLQRDGHSWFQLAITNRSNGYVPIHADLRVSKGTGHAIELADGFGRWLAPGQSQQLRFDPDIDLEATDYQISLMLQTAAGDEPFQRTLNVRIEPNQP